MQDFPGLIIVLLIAYSLACGILSMNLADYKGYSAPGWLAVGFFLGILGLIAAAGLPIKSQTQNK
jgi:hypothetical protein